MRLKVTMLLAAYIVLAGWNAGALYADFVKATPSIYRGEEGHRLRRVTTGLVVFLAILPPTVLVAPFSTGFYYSGWMMPGSEPPQESK